MGFWFVEVFVNSFIDDLAYIGEAHSSVRVLGFRRGVYVMSAILWNFTQRRLVICYRSFGTAYRFWLQKSRE